MKSLRKINKKIVTLFILFLFAMSILPSIGKAPTHSYAQVVLPSDYFIKINHTCWISYLVKENVTRRIGITIEPPFYLTHVTVKKTIKPNLFGEIELHGTITYKSSGVITLNAWLTIFSNQDSVLFLKAENKTGETVPFFYRVSYEDEKSKVWRTREIFPIMYTNNILDPVSNPMRIEKSASYKTKGEPYFFQTLRYDEVIHQVLKGPIFIYKNLPDGLQERVDSVASSEVVTQQGRLTFDNNALFGSESFLEDWMFFSNNHLLSINSSVTKKIIQTLDFYKLKRYSRDGFYYKCVSDGYRGENDSTYYWDYSMYGARSILEYYYSGDQSLFYDIAMLSFLSLSRNRNASGYWSNQTVSSWLATDYNITSVYFDTRFNVDAGIFLLEVYKNFKIPYALTMAEKIGNILLVMMQNGKAYPTANLGCLLQDYDVSFTSTKRTHASLNHVLNESSFFLLLFETTHQEEYLFASNKLMLGIMATEEKWKDKKTGDLFYCMFPDKSFGRKDYVTLTYHDLIRSKRLLLSVLGLENRTIQRLGSFKETHLLYLGMIKSKKFLTGKEF
jgi:hypothetical protein